ncbi:MAG: ABC transporter permease, partial [Clostridia bacterium]|nr:ABC transporter permease [Clostridia bacterium]
VWLSPAAYAELLDTPPSLARIRVAVSPELDAAPRNALCDAIDQLRRIWGLSSGTDHIEAHFSEYVLAAQTPRLFPLLAILSLCFVPIIWFYTQSSFYAGRAQEYRTLTAFGALSKALQYQRRIEGVFCVGLAMLLTIGFAFGLTWGYFKLVNHLLYAGGFLTPSCRLTYGLSLPMLVISMIISLVCGLCSAALPSLVCKSTHECSQNVSHFL